MQKEKGLIRKFVISCLGGLTDKIKFCTWIVQKWPKQAKKILVWEITEIRHNGDEWCHLWKRCHQIENNRNVIINLKASGVGNMPVKYFTIKCFGK